ncbi:potassium-transporting ATPase subunit KdpC [Streptomyces zagrosensis]|uniref:Potassium-transporting ATPase KdpC subunit n=1 Tax=Streptomyces zagrosensis TaxID=1042984 RepID=A0A7W9QCA9_9ACTN|nr:potassium-transporting ATPase subunit KdpC [Streptomyces zagrosensis]MBB5937613.1 K+-transporting ATPase ATPase C chain [Streptomyces zagrosensis]
MNQSVRSTARLLTAGLRALLVLTLVCGVIYPLVVTGVAQAVFHDKANGSEIKENGKVVGSKLIGQSFTLDAKDKDGNPLPDPKWFQPRPSAAGENVFNTRYSIVVSGASNLASDSKILKDSVIARRAAVATFNGVPQRDVPVDALTASGSGLDPHISPDYADIQVSRVAKQHGLSRQAVQKLVDEHTDGRQFGFLGEPHLNVLALNVAVRDLATQQGRG